MGVLIVVVFYCRFTAPDTVWCFLRLIKITVRTVAMLFFGTQVRKPLVRSLANPTLFAVDVILDSFL
jgi:hypothetical protein